MALPKLYKALKSDMHTPHQRWKWTRNQFTTPISYLNPCNSGYHVTTAEDCGQWLARGCFLWEVELPKGAKTLQSTQKWVVSSAKVTKKVGYFPLNFRTKDMNGNISFAEAAAQYNKRFGTPEQRAKYAKEVAAEKVAEAKKRAQRRIREKINTAEYYLRNDKYAAQQAVFSINRAKKLIAQKTKALPGLNAKVKSRMATVAKLRRELAAA